MDDKPLPPAKKDKKSTSTTKKTSVVKTEEIIESTKHNINYFEEIGWLDPYPTNIAEQKKAMQVNVMNLNLNVLAYDQSRYMEDFSPSIIFLPTVECMKKIFRVFNGAVTIADVMSKFT